jgi:hypothetical protein
LERIADGLRDFEFVIWIDDKCARELLGSTRKLRKDQDSRVSRVLSRNVFLGNQVHPVTHRCDKCNAREAVQGGK